MSGIGTYVDATSGATLSWVIAAMLKQPSMPMHTCMFLQGDPCSFIGFM